MTMTAIQAQLLDLDAMDEAQCTSLQEHKCSGRAWFRAISTCDDSEALWCVSRHAVFLSVVDQDWNCYSCHRLQALCWTVLPV